MYALGGRLYVATTEVEMLCIEDGVVMRNFSCLPTKKSGSQRKPPVN